jgi:multisubunit Na+/H+ antiporter MnhF subunit
MTLLDHATDAGLVLLGISILLGLIRLARGPTVVDRMLAFDVVALCIVGMMTLLAIRSGTSAFLELILIFAMLGFLSTVTFVFYLSRTSSRDSHHGEPPPEDPHEDP